MRWLAFIYFIFMDRVSWNVEVLCALCAVECISRGVFEKKRFLDMKKWVIIVYYGARARAGGTCLVAVLHAASVIGCWGRAAGAASVIVCW